MVIFKKWWIAIGILFLLTAPATSADEIKMDLNAIYGPSSFHTQGAINFAKLTEQYTDGSVKIIVHPGGSLGFKGPELLKVVKDGQVPMSDILMGVVAGSAHVFGISSLPRLVLDFDSARKLYEESKPLYDTAAEKWNQKLLYAAPWPPSGLVTQKPIQTLEDLKGIKTRTYDKNGAEFLKALGAAPISLPWGEVYSSLRTGMIDSVLTSAESANNGKFWEVLNHFKKINYAYPLNMVTINLDYWNALSKKQQEALLKAAEETEKAQWQDSHDRNVASLKAIQDEGIQVSDEDRELSMHMNTAARKIIDEFAAEAEADTKQVINQFLKK